MNTVVQVTSLDAAKRTLERMGFQFESRPNQAFLARLDRLVVNAYASGKILIQGGPPEKAAIVAEALGGTPAKTERSPSAAHNWVEALPFPRIGIDEAGKGDYFGPLVIAAAKVSGEQFAQLQALGVRDSKKIPTSRIADFAGQIQKVLGTSGFSVVEIGPRKYNELYEKIGNLNELLAWGHARALENLLSTGAVAVAVSDQFGSPTFIQDALMKQGKTVELLQRTHAEEDTVVAAASILARQRFLQKLDELSKKMGIPLPRGSTTVQAAAEAIVKKSGAFALADCAKLHFKTTEKIVDRPDILRDAVRKD